MSLRLHAPVVLPCDESCSVLRDAVVDVVDGRITYVGELASAPAFDGEVRRLSGILLPGLVNTHAHSPMTVLRGLGSDLPLLRWLQEQMWPNEARMTAADVGTGMLLGAVEMLRHGVTTSAEMYFHGPELVSSVLAAGSRVVFGGAIGLTISNSGMVYPVDAADLPGGSPMAALLRYPQVAMPVARTVSAT